MAEKSIKYYDLAIAHVQNKIRELEEKIPALNLPCESCVQIESTRRGLEAENERLDNFSQGHTSNTKINFNTLPQTVTKCS